MQVAAKILKVSWKWEVVAVFLREVLTSWCGVLFGASTNLPKTHPKGSSGADTATAILLILRKEITKLKTAQLATTERVFALH